MPLSTTAPNPVEPSHHCTAPCSLPGKLARKEAAAKRDVLATVSLERSDRVMIGKEPGGKRIYVADPPGCDDGPRVGESSLIQ